MHLVLAYFRLSQIQNVNRAINSISQLLYNWFRQSKIRELVLRKMLYRFTENFKEPNILHRYVFSCQWISRGIIFHADAKISATRAKACNHRWLPYFNLQPDIRGSVLAGAEKEGGSPKISQSPIDSQLIARRRHNRLAMRGMVAGSQQVDSSRQQAAHGALIRLAATRNSPTPPTGSLSLGRRTLACCSFCLPSYVYHTYTRVRAHMYRADDWYTRTTRARTLHMCIRMRTLIPINFETVILQIRLENDSCDEPWIFKPDFNPNRRPIKSYVKCNNFFYTYFYQAL